MVDSSDDMNIEQIMRQLREKIKYSNPDVPDPFPELPETFSAPASLPSAPVTDPDLIYINQNYDTYCITTPSAYGRLGDCIKRGVSFLIGFQTLKQTQFNASVVRLLNNMINNITLMSTRLETLENGLNQFKREKDRLSSQMDSEKKVSGRSLDKE
jgi:hypothetical protein